MQVDETKDNALRESIINATGVITFDPSHPFTLIAHGLGLTKHTVVAADAHAIETQTF